MPLADGHFRDDISRDAARPVGGRSTATGRCCGTSSVVPDIPPSLFLLFYGR